MSVIKPLRLLSPFALLASLLIQFIIGQSTWAQSTSPNPKEFSKRLQVVSERVSEAPIPPPKYLRRLWHWKKAKEAEKSLLNESKALQANLNPSLLSQLQADLWKALGQASKTPLYESPRSRDQREYKMDLETKGTPILPNYTHEFIPSITPHKRMTSWNVIKRSGELAVDIGGLTEIESINMPQLTQCLKSAANKRPSSTHYLSFGEEQWYAAQDLDIHCLQSQCFQKGSACFVGVFSTENWTDFTRPRGIASVSPEQSLVTFGQRSAVILSQDDAGNFYLSASPDSPLNKITKIALVVTAPRSYFSGSWRSALGLSELKDHPNLALPLNLQRQALHLSAQLFKYDSKHARLSFEDLMFQLSDYFRAFTPGEQTLQDGSVYERLTLSQIGVCRHRSYAFMVTARALGIPTRYITNQVHAFVEVLDPSGRWRRVDLGGEGIAPEEQGLTQELLANSKQSPQAYRPDDGLPRPDNYQNIQREQEALKQNIQTEKSKKNHPHKTSPDQIADPNADPSELGSIQDTSSDAATELGTQESMEQKSFNQTPPHNPHHTPPQDSTSEQIQTSPMTHKDDGQLHESSIEMQRSRPLIHNQKQELEDSIKAQFNTASCKKPYINYSNLERQDQVQVLNRLNQLIHQDYTFLKLKSPSLKIILKSLLQTAIHRCDILRLKGRIKTKSKSLRRKLKNTWILAALKSKNDGVILSGWGQIDARGFYNFKAQVPVRMNAGDYQVFVYFPAQKGIVESWSKLDYE